MGPMGSVCCERAMKMEEVIFHALAEQPALRQGEEVVAISDRPAAAELWVKTTGLGIPYLDTSLAAFR